MSDVSDEMIWRLRNDNQVPPGGWHYRCSATGWSLPNGTSGSLVQKVKDVLDHHLANPAKNLELNPEKIQLEVYRQTVENVLSLRGGLSALERVPKPSAPVAARQPGPQAHIRHVADVVAGDSMGAKIIAEWFGDGGHPVSKIHADARALACLQCPLHDPKQRSVIGAVAEVVKWASEFKNKTKLNLNLEDELGTCSVCGCHLPTKLWVPIKHLERDQTHEYPLNCWIPKERNSLHRIRHDLSDYSFTQNRPEPPAVTVQSGWPAGIFDIKSKDGDLYFNPGLIRFNGSLYLASRYMPFPYQRATVMFIKLDDDLKPLSGTEIKFTRTYPHEHIEDGRCIPIPGETEKFLLATTGFYVSSKQHQQIFVVKKDFTVERQIHIKYRGNGSSIDSQVSTEKNWQFFYVGRSLHFVYLIAPKHIVCETASDSVSMEYSTDTPMIWPYGALRGGTPPVLIGDLYWSFFHSHQNKDPNTRRYFMGVYAFDSKPPFQVRYMSKHPILAGTLAHPVTLWRHMVVFPSGAIYDPSTGEWLVVFGVNDCLNAWIKIPHRELLETVA